MPKKVQKPITKKVAKKWLLKLKKIRLKRKLKTETINLALKFSINRDDKTSEDGITLKQICENLKWQSHTARSVISA